MFSRTVYQGKSAYSWNTTARSHPGSVMSVPSTRMSPRVGCSKPATQVEQRRLAAAARADDGKELVLFDLEVHIVQRQQRLALRRDMDLADVRDVDLSHPLAAMPRASAPGARHDEPRSLAHAVVEHQPQHADHHHAEQ